MNYLTHNVVSGIIRISDMILIGLGIYHIAFDLFDLTGFLGWAITVGGFFMTLVVLDSSLEGLGVKWKVHIELIVLVIIGIDCYIVGGLEILTGY